MATQTSITAAQQTLSPLRVMAEQAFSRTAGAPLIPGNKVVLLKDAAENYGAWFEAIRAAREAIDFESYFIRADKTGYEFAGLLESKAREGVRVRLIYDWFGARGASSSRLWRGLKNAGAEVRCFNPPRLDDPIEALRRDHRKTITIDGRIGFVSGLCVSQRWVGDAARGIEPWRDTGVKIEGPAVQDLQHAFARMWNLIARPDSPARDCCADSDARPWAGDVCLRIVPGEPTMAGLYRLDLLVAALARKSIWLTDAYYLGAPSYVQSLRAAALDGVDVRLLVPRTSDIPMLRALSRTGYRTLLEAGVRIFEWNGSMLHAKTGVADGRWARVGSTNLNLASWMSNYEMDVVVEDETFAEAMSRMYLDDLEHSTEIVLSERAKVRPVEHRKRRLSRTAARGSAGRAATGVLAMGNAVGTAVTTPRLLGPAESPVLFVIGVVLLGVIAFAVFLPRIISILVAIFCGWIAAILLIKAFRLKFSRKNRD